MIILAFIDLGLIYSEILQKELFSAQELFIIIIIIICGILDAFIFSVT